MRAVITGGRDYMVTLLDEEWLDDMCGKIGITMVIEGGCRRKDFRGDDLPTADLGAKRWAMKRGIPVATMDANWAFHGKAAGPIRNGDMAVLAEVCLAFPGGRGTADMKNQAIERGLTVHESPGRKP